MSKEYNELTLSVNEFNDSRVIKLKITIEEENKYKDVCEIDSKGNIIGTSNLSRLPLDNLSEESKTKILNGTFAFSQYILGIEQFYDHYAIVSNVNELNCELSGDQDL